jgi:hypothetical protein
MAESCNEAPGKPSSRGKSSQKVPSTNKKDTNSAKRIIFITNAKTMRRKEKENNARILKIWVYAFIFELFY